MGQAGDEPVAVPGAYARAIAAPDGERHRILVGLPEASPPPEGFPMLIVLDGAQTFAPAWAMLRAQAARPALTGIAPAILVGLGGEDEAGRRIRDYTPPVPRARLAPRPNGVPWPETGGADAFLDCIEEVVLPYLARRHPVDPARLALFGHSLGGLLGLHALLTRPRLFAAVAASSPSIWFGDRAIREALPPAPSPATAPTYAPRLLVTVGGDEGSAPASAGADYAAWVRRNRMVANARDLVHDLAGRGWSAAFHCFEGENHASVLPYALNHALRFALRTRYP